MARRKAIDAGWAAFNIGTDANQFDFKVALGATVTGFRDPESTEIILSGLDDTATCRVSIQKTTPRGLVRASILYFWALREVPKEDLLRRLDRAVFDRSQIEELRTRANQYWGLKGSTEERIHSARWGAGGA